MEIGELLDQVKPATRTVRICLDGSLAEQLEELRARWTELAGAHQGMGAPPEVTEVIDQIRALEQAADAATVEFHVRSIGAKAWRRLGADHPPPDDNLEGWRWNMETFIPAAIAASAVDPAMTDTQADQLAERLSNGQLSKLWGAVLDVNTGDDLIPKFGPATAAPPTSG